MRRLVLIGSLVAAAAFSAPADPVRTPGTPPGLGRAGTPRLTPRARVNPTPGRAITPGSRKPAVTHAATRTMSVSVQVVPAQRPVTAFALSQNFPNPFHGGTTIRYAVPRRSACSVRVYSVTGQCVATLVNWVQDPGEYTIRWDGSDDRGNRLRAGLYFCRMEAGSYVERRKLICE